MLTSSASQYLHPGDYLQPLPTTLDAKKSPLALLAQTCSSIGKDTGPSKPIIPPIEKKDVAQDGGRKTESPSGKSTTSSEGRESQGDERQSGSPSKDPATSKSSSFRTPPPKDIPPLVPVTPKSDGHKTPTSSSADGRNSSKPSASSPSTSSASTTSSSGHSNSRISLNCGSLSLEVNHQESTSHAASRTSLPPSFPAGKPDSLGAHSLLSHSYPGLPFLGHPGLDPAHYSSLAAHSALLAAAHHKPGLSPYVKYTTVKTASGATTLVPVCSDPYCTHCKLTLSSAQLSPATASSSTCGAGCTQYTHDKPTLPPHPPTSLSLPHVLSSSSTAALSSLYPHQPFSVLPGHHGLPYICNWVAGSDYCGKRFATSEELLQHLRTHTSSSEAGASAAAAAAALGQGFSPYSSLGLSASALAAASHSHLPGSLSPNSSLRAAAAAASYPRTLSPNSVLAAARYHPYSKSAASSLLPTAPPPSLGAYYPYAAAAALYSQRLGAVP